MALDSGIRGNNVIAVIQAIIESKSHIRKYESRLDAVPHSFFLQHSRDLITGKARRQRWPPGGNQV